jgi:hypothetical protein
MQIKQTIQELDINVQSYHVKGHQDRNKNIHEISYEEQLNIEADKLATAA